MSEWRITLCFDGFNVETRNDEDPDWVEHSVHRTFQEAVEEVGILLDRIIVVAQGTVG